MRWEELTGDQFPEAVQKAEGVCLLPLSVIERHAHHLPLGTDMYIGRDLCLRAAAIEPAIIFPDHVYTQILEAKHVPGTIAIDAALLLPLLDNICREIARNGLKKIVLVNAHGGNSSLLPLLGQFQLQNARDYVVYIADTFPHPDEDTEIRGMFETEVDGHAGEVETSMVMSIRPDLVQADQIHSDGEGMPQERLKHLSKLGIYTGIWWYADHPTHFRGDATLSTAEKGERLLASRARKLAAAIKVIKGDSETMRLQNEFYSKHQHSQ
jgi:creatinine amidohydrolase